MKRLARAFGFLLLALPPWFNVMAQSTTNLSPAMLATMSNQVARLEADWKTAHLAHDAAAIEKLCADDLTVIVPAMPPIHKAGAVGALRAGGLKFVQFETSEVSMRFPAPDVAIVTGRLQRVRMVQEKLVTDDLRFTKVWIRSNGGWQVTAFHASPYSL